VEAGLRVQNAIFSGGRLEGSKRNLKFQSATWHHFKQFQNKDLFFLAAFLSQDLNYSAIIICGQYFITSAVKILIIIAFKILGVRPTSTLGPRRDQLVVAFKSQMIEPHALKGNSKFGLFTKTEVI